MTEKYEQDSDVDMRPKQGNTGKKREKKDADYVKGKKKTRDM